MAGYRSLGVQLDDRARDDHTGAGVERSTLLYRFLQDRGLVVDLVKHEGSCDYISHVAENQEKTSCIAD